MPDVVEHLRQLDPVHPTRWSGTAEGRATRARVFDGLAGRSRPRSRTTPMLVAAGLVLAIVALVFVATRGSRDTAPLARSRANFSTGTWTVARGGPGHFSPTSAFWTGDEYFVTGKIGCCWAGETYRPSTKTWRRVPDPPRQPGDEAVFTGKAIIWQESGVAYDPARRAWDVLANPLPLPFADPLVVWMGHELAVIGGNTAAACRGECPGAIGAAAYSPDQDRWRRIAEPPVALSSAASAIWDGKEVLLVDPLNGLPPQNFVGVYDPLRDVWQSLPPPGPQALGGSPVAAQRRVATFALEGTDTRLVAQVFDVRRRKWSSAASDMAGSTCEPQSVAVRGGAVVECREIELFDLASLRWRAMPQPPMPVVNLVWTGKELLGTSANGEHLLVYRPGR
jgi:HAMP domain-containing protein